MLGDYKPHGVEAPIDRERCRASVPNGGRSVTFHQCRRKPVDSSERYCRIHSPEYRAERRAERDAVWAARIEQERARQVRQAVSLLESLGYTVTAPRREEPQP